MQQMNLFTQTPAGNEIIEQARAIAAGIAALPADEQIRVLNEVRRLLHEVSPFRSEPVDCVLWVPADQVEANDYNPNRVAPPEMKLLARSIETDGYTQPVVGWQANGRVEVVDGYHRTRVGREVSSVRKRVRGHLPVAFISSGRQGRKERIAATIRHNRARGVHGVIPMTDIVADLITNGWTDDEVARELGMDADEVLRFKQTHGLPELFKDHEYSRAWE
jgi:ParB-like chromosome segregation protein Spo0J